MSVEALLTFAIPAAPALAGLVALGGRHAEAPLVAHRAVQAGCAVGCAAAFFALLLMLAGVWRAPGPVEWWQWLPPSLIAPGGTLTVELDEFGAAFAGALMLSAVLGLRPGPNITGHEPTHGLARPAVAFLVASTALLVLAHDFLSLLLFWEVSATAAWAVASTQPDSANAARRMWCVQRVLDVPLVIAVMALGAWLGTWSFAAMTPGPGSVLAERLHDDLPTSVLLRNRAAVTLMASGVFCGVAGRCALFPLFGWARTLCAASPRVGTMLLASLLAPAGVVVLIRIAPLTAVSFEARLLVTGVAALSALLAVAVAAAGSHRAVTGGFVSVALLAICLALVGTASPALVQAAGVLLLCIILVSPLLARFAAGGASGSLSEPSGGPAFHSPIDVRRAGAFRQLAGNLFAAETGLHLIAVRPLRGMAWLVRRIDDGLNAAWGGRLAVWLLRSLAAATDPVRGAGVPFYSLALALGTAVLALLLLRGTP